MTKKNFRILMVLALLSFLLLATPATTNILSVTPSKTNSVAKVDNTASSSGPSYNVTQGSTLYYNITSILTNSTYPYMNITNNYNQPVGKLETGYTLGYNFEASGNNGSTDYVNGSIQSATLNQSIWDQYFFIYPQLVLSNFKSNDRPAFLYFALPHYNLTSFEANFTTAGFTVTDTANTFNVHQATTYTNGNLYLNITWDKNTGIMLHYNQTTVDTSSSPSLTSAIVLDFIQNFNVADFMPDFTAHNPGMFYNINTLQVNSSNQLNLDNMNQPNTYGYIQQGQTALVDVQAQIVNNAGPTIGGFLTTLTGEADLSNPFNQSNNFDQGAPDMFFMFPVSSNPGWWGNVSLALSVQGIQTVFQNATTIWYRQFDLHNTNNNVTFIFNKITGVMAYYNLQTVNKMQLPGTNQVVPYNLELTFIKMYGLKQLYPHFGPLLNQQFRYHLDTLNVGGLTAAPVDIGYFQQGQDIDILFNALGVQNGMNAQLVLSTKTGQTKSNVLYDLARPWQSGDNNQGTGSQSLLNGPALFLPAIPINATSNWFAFLNDSFSRIVGASMVNNATTFGIQVGSMTVNNSVQVNHLNAFWNKTDGLMVSYDFSAYSLTNNTDSINLKLHLVGKSTGQTLFTASSSTTTTPPSTPSNTTTTSGRLTTTTPGFSLIALLSVFIGIAVITRKRKHN